MAEAPVTGGSQPFFSGLTYSFWVVLWPAPAG